MIKIHAYIPPGVRDADAEVGYCDEGGPDGISIEFAGLTSPDEIRGAKIPWFDGRALDLDGLKAVVPPLRGYGWATGRRDIRPTATAVGLTFTVAP